MSESIITETNSSDDSKGKAFGLTGNNYLYPVISLLGSSIVFGLFYYGLELDLIASALIALPPVLLGTSYMWLLVEGKPIGYAGDFIENLFYGGNWTCANLSQPKHPLSYDVTNSGE